MNAPISTVTQRERDLWAAAGRVVSPRRPVAGCNDHADHAEPDDETVHVSDEALDDFLDGGAISC